VPSLKNNCSDCPIKNIEPEGYKCYSVDANKRLQNEVVAAVLFHAGIESNKASETVIDKMAKQCVNKILKDECESYSLKNNKFVFKSK